MIVTCPACQTRYLVDDALLGGEEGRRVRCASCGNLWHYSPDAAAIQMAVAEATAAVAAAVAVSPAAGPAPVAPALRAEPGTQSRPHPMGPTAPARPAGPTALARPSVAVERPAARRRAARARVGRLGLIVLAATLVLVAIIARDRIMAIWPSATPVYAALHLTGPPGAGLKVTLTQNQTPDLFVVDGDIINNGTTPRPVPQLLITLRDGNGSDLASKVIAPPVNQLPPGATAHFTTTFEHPSITAVGADVTFAPD